MLNEAITLSILLGFLSSELFGLYAGGMVSAGYIAYYVEYPFRLASTVVVAIATCLLTKLLRRFTIIYGRRRFMVTVMISMIATWLFEQFFYYYITVIPQDVRIIGYIVPGLLANDMLKQGILKTLFMAGICVVIIRLIIMAGVI